MNYIGDFTEDFATLSFKFLTTDIGNTGASIPVTLLGTPVISVYKDNSLVQSIAGITLTVDFDGITGLNQVEIDLSADAFYEYGSDYSAIVTAGTVAGDSIVGREVASFSIENRSAERILSVVSNLTTGAAAPSVAAESAVITTGTEVNTYASTADLDGGYHEVSDVGGAIDFYYQFDIGNGRLAASVAMNGRLEGKDDTVGVYAYNWVTTSWNQIGTMIGSSAGTSDGVAVFTVLSDHTGIGIDEGKVRIRGIGSSLTSATMYLDRAVVRHATNPVSKQTKGVVVDASATTTSFKTDLTQATGLWDDALLIFVDGALEGESIPILTYVSTNGAMTFDEAFIAAPANGDTFIIEHTHIHTVAQIATAVRVEVDSNSTQLAVILADTNELQTDDIPATLATIASYIDTEIGTIITNLATVDTVVDGIQSDLSNGVDGLGALKALIDTLDTVADAVKAKTDQLTFTKALELDTNTQSINGATVVGDGNAVPWDGT